MKRIRTALISLALLAGCSTQTGLAKNSNDPAAKVTGADASCCADEATTGGSCCDAPTKAGAMAAKAEKKADGCGEGCCGACVPDAAPKQP